MLQTESMLRQYKVLEILGEGGFATTYLAIDTSLQKKFAIKEYCPPEFAFREGATIRIKPGCIDNFSWGRDRFLEEARVLARFNHPNVVSVNQIFEENNTAYMVLEYQSGRSLEAWLKEFDGPPNQDELDLVLRPLLSALDAIHRNNVLHRDIAPDNLYIRDDGTPVLLDFGSAKEAVAARTKAVSAVVKDGFSPPEQYSTRGTAQGPWTDIYALAATIYYAITKKTPPGSTERLMEDDLPPISVLAPTGFRASFLNAIDWGLKLPPKERPQSIDAWRDMLIDGKGTNSSVPITGKSQTSEPQTTNAANQNSSDGSGDIKPKHMLIGGLVLLFAAGNFWAYKSVQTEAERNGYVQMETRQQLDQIQKQTLELQQQRVAEERLRQEEARRRQSIADDTARRAQAEAEERRRVLEQEELRRRQTLAEEAARRAQAEAEEQRRRAENERLRAALPRVCADALNVMRNDWDRTPQYADALRTALQSGLSVEDCRQYMGFSRTPMTIRTGGYDLPGHDLGLFTENTSLPVCHNQCEQNSSCSGYTHNPRARGGACQLKSINGVTLMTPAASPDVTSAFKSAANSYIRFINIEIKWNNDIFGSPFFSSQIDFENCAIYCSGNGNCRGFTWNENTRICQQYGSGATMRPVRGSGIRAGVRQ